MTQVNDANFFPFAKTRIPHGRLPDQERMGIRSQKKTYVKKDGPETDRRRAGHMESLVHYFYFEKKNVHVPDTERTRPGHIES